MKEGNMTQNKRCFAFGCSYTKYRWPTWADVIGENFHFYKNYGRGGASNLYILQKFIQANDLYKFTKDDVILVMLTGFGRFTYYENNALHTHGEIRSWYHSTQNPSMGKFLDSGIWTEDLGATNSYIAAKTIKELLTHIGCEYKIHLAIDNSHFIKHPSRFLQTEIALHFAEKFYSVLDITWSMDEWMKQRYNDDDYYKFDDEPHDHHPTIDMAENYVMEYFPKYYTETSKQFINTEKNQIIWASHSKQGHVYSERQLERWGKDEVQVW
jgi:hypothetical protein